MTVKRGLISLTLTFGAILALLVVTASARETKHITFADPVTIGQAVLEAGDYAVRWEGTGPEVMVSFLNYKDEVVATAPAKIVPEKSRERAIMTRTLPDNSKVLTRLVFKSLTLDFENVGGE